jgi:pimeloyl-ACP methyl ester carboxylesterase
MKPTRSLEGLCQAAVTVTLLLTCSVSSGGQTRRYNGPVGSQAADEVARARGGPAQPAACRDTTPHQVTFVEVEPGVRLEVLDWGGADKPQTMVLLTGLGDNAHVYDPLAFQFTDDFHVIGITRRGFLPSSQPEHGYDVETRARDDIAVLDALGIRKATFVGHSLAGSELSKLGEVYHTRVEKLVYLDAADLAERFFPSRTEPPGPQSLFTSATLTSLWTYQAASARFTALREPDPAVCIGAEFDRHGALTGSTTPDWVSTKLLEGVAGAVNPPVNWANIEAPRLGIFALFTIEARQAWYWYLTSAEQAAFDEAWPPIVAWHQETITKFADNNPIPPLILLLPGAPHYVYINHETEVVREMRKFLGLPVGGN